MQQDQSFWGQLTGQKDNMLDLPPLEYLVPPMPDIMSGLLRRGPSWIVGPPKVGKTVIAHYAAYLTCLGLPAGAGETTVMTFEGAPECSRAVDLVLEAPYCEGLAAVIFENPFGADAARPNAIFLRQLGILAEKRLDIKIFVTTRPRGYLKYKESIEQVLEYRTPLAFSEWYAPEALDRYAKLRGGALDEQTIARLAAPALIDDFIFNDIAPGTARQRARLRRSFGKEIEDVTLDKFALLRDDRELGLVAALVRLQEHAYSLPTVDELAKLTRFSIEDHAHLRLVATPYRFDGLKRLRFEHATAREAADLLLREASEDGFADLRSRLNARAHAPWLERSFELWSAQQDIVAGRWTDFHSRHSAVRSALVTDALSSAADEMGVAVAGISELGYDAWTAQDIAYEIAAAWPEYSGSPQARGLISQLLRDEESHGTYAILEALLYIRGRDVQSLWHDVDNRLAEMADAPAGEFSRELLLAVDGLAWRPPPEWHSLGSWVRSFFEKLTPEHESFAFVRFMSGYHPEGLQYLRSKMPDLIDGLVLRDRVVRWTREQAALASWLVQWHFVHQCRARAQLARQPWIDQQFLCRSFHPDALKHDHDAAAAGLIRSLRESGVDAEGWGFFLAENLRAVAPGSYGDKTAAEAQQTLAQASASALGVVAAVLTYSPAPRILPQVRQFFRRPEAFSALVRALNEGLTVAGTALDEPRFAYRRELSGIYATCGIDWDGVKSSVPAAELLDVHGRFDVNGFIANLEDAAKDEALDQGEEFNATLDLVMARVRRGDLTVLCAVPQDAESTGEAVADQSEQYRAILRASVAAVLNTDRPGT